MDSCVCRETQCRQHRENVLQHPAGVRRLVAVAEAGFDAAAVVGGVGDAEERRAEDATDGRDVEVVEDVGGAQVDGEGLLVLGLEVVGEVEGALEVGVEVEGPGQVAFVARERADAAGGDELAPGSCIAAGAGIGIDRAEGCAGGCVLRAIVEVAVAVVVEAGGDVVGLQAGAAVVGTERKLGGKVDGGIAEDLPQALIVAAGVLAGVDAGGLGSEEGVVVRVVDDNDADGAGEELDALEGLLADAHGLDIGIAAASALHLEDVEVGAEGAWAGG